MAQRSMQTHCTDWTPRPRGRHALPKQPSRLLKSVTAGIPMLVAGSMTVGMALTSPVAPPQGERAEKERDASSLREAVRSALAQQKAPDAAVAAAESAVAAAPSSYTVVAGDTVSAIAARHGLSTASVLALNGLGWSSLIFPGQVLTLSSAAPAPTPPAATPAPAPLAESYTIRAGDTVSSIAARHGVSTQSVLSANGLGWSSIIYPGQRLIIPGAAPASATPPSTSAPAPAPVPTTSAYTVRSGDTVSAIAAKHGVSTQAVLSANGLGWSSIIYPGQQLTIPGVTVSSTPSTSTIVPLTAEMAENARIIIEVGRSLGVPEYGIVIALAAAAQESTLRNLTWGDRDSIGLFQQRPSAGWGTVEQILDRHHSARLFYGGPSNPNRGKTRGLLDISGWQSMTVTQAAQAVQRSAYPDYYAKWETSARAWLAQLG